MPRRTFFWPFLGIFLLNTQIHADENGAINEREHFVQFRTNILAHKENMLGILQNTVNCIRGADDKEALETCRLQEASALNVALPAKH